MSLGGRGLGEEEERKALAGAAYRHCAQTILGGGKAAFKLATGMAKPFVQLEYRLKTDL